MKKILIISNTACSESESNGRIHSLHYLKYIESGNVFNLYINGIPDVEKVNYIHFSNKQALLSKLLGKKICPTIFAGKKQENISIKKTKKSNFPFFHFARNAVYSKNKKILNYLTAIIEKNNIDSIVLWGSNVPFLYEYSFYLSKHCGKNLFIFTGEDYPLKNYNYISKFPSLFFKPFQRKLRKMANQAYQTSFKNIFATKELEQSYISKFSLSNTYVVNFSSLIQKTKNLPSEINKILYAGNLYSDRVNSLIDIALHIKEKNDVVIDVYGNASKKLIKKMSKIGNINYLGTVPYNELMNKFDEADLLLHIEGFSNYYKKDCRYAFSTKISDYFMMNKPFFIYGPLEISGVNFAYKINEKFVAVSRNDLIKLDEILNGNVKYSVEYELLLEKFSASKNAEKMFEIIEN